MEVGSAPDFEASPLQLRGVVKNAIVEALASRGVAAELDADSPDVVFVVRRAGVPEARRTVVGIDIGGGARHRRGARVAMGPAPLRETMAAQVIMLSRWDARTEPLVDPMAGGGTIPIEAAGLAVGAAIRNPLDLPLRHLAAFEDLPSRRRISFPAPCRASSRSTWMPREFPPWWEISAPPGSRAPRTRTRSSSPAGRACADSGLRRAHAARRARHEAGRLLLQSAVWRAHGRGRGEEELLALYSDMGRAFARFSGWRAACFVANPRFVDAFGHAPVMTKPASNADLRGAFLVYEL